MKNLKTKWDKGFYGCPGAWLGNKPEGTQTGNITVDISRIDEAVPHIRRFFSVIQCKLSKYAPAENPAIMFEVIWKV